MLRSGEESNPSPSRPERRRPRERPPSDPGSAEYSGRRAEYHYKQLAASWSSCPECGGGRLLRPTARHLRAVPEAQGVCADCESAFMLDPDGLIRFLQARRQP